ncbi:DUF885 family protein [Streptomyces sp. NPDC012438]|uniref:DUF885 family protein n=1 Tax=Streptomyces sp. NPDC012438 TaxID=3364833 RepID=UPI0036E33F4A
MRGLTNELPPLARELDALGEDRYRLGVREFLGIGLHLRLPVPADTGFHEGERWTARLGRAFLLEHRGLGPAGFVDFEIDRYPGRPGRAIAYKPGEKVWLESRDAARRRDGADFDLKRFHRQALDLGPMGLDLLREAGRSLEVCLPERSEVLGGASLQEREAQRELLAPAEVIRVLPFAPLDRDARVSADERLVRGCARLLAVRDGPPSCGRDATAHMVACARAHGIAVEVVWPTGAARRPFDRGLRLGTRGPGR